MDAVTFQVPNDVLEKIEKIAAEKDISVSELLSSVTSSIVVEHDAEARFRERAKAGAGLDKDALALLRRP